MPSLFSLQLMLVDPDDDLRFLLKTLLELSGCKVETACNYSEASSKVEKILPDVIFTELFLGDATGFDFARRIRSMPRAGDTLLVALTGHYYHGIAQDACTTGFDRFLLKPVQYDQILGVLASAAKRRRGYVSKLENVPKAAA